MRKRIMDAAAGHANTDEGGDWLDLESIASVEVTSEDAGFPVEGAFSTRGGPGWRAGSPGEQVIRLVFDEPRAVRTIQLAFSEKEVERTQEFTLGWSQDHALVKEIVRQQYTFSPGGSTQQTEEYNVNLDRVHLLELRIRPELGAGKGTATLTSFRVN